MEAFNRFMYKYILPPTFSWGENNLNWIQMIPILGDLVKSKFMAIDMLHLKSGDDVLVYCIGTEM